MLWELFLNIPIKAVFIGVGVLFGFMLFVVVYSIIENSIIEGKWKLEEEKRKRERDEIEEMWKLREEKRKRERDEKK